MKITVVPEFAGLCGSCRHAMLVHTVQGKFIAQCDWLRAELPEPVTACSKYDDRRIPSLFDMRQTAWILRTNDDKQAIGFVSNKQWRKSREFRNERFSGEDD